jgi:hypothetical protein
MFRAAMMVYNLLRYDAHTTVVDVMYLVHYDGVPWALPSTLYTLSSAFSIALFHYKNSNSNSNSNNKDTMSSQGYWRYYYQKL